MLGAGGVVLPRRCIACEANVSQRSLHSQVVNIQGKNTYGHTDQLLSYREGQSAEYCSPANPDY